MGIDFQVHRAAVDAAKGYRQFQKADNLLDKEKFDAAARHLNKGLEEFSAAFDHLVKAEEDAYAEAGQEIDKGNKELRKAIDDYADGKFDRAQSHYGKALDSYDLALDMLDV